MAVAFSRTSSGVISGKSFLYQYLEPTAVDQTRIIAAGAFEYDDPERSSKIAGLLSKAMQRVADFHHYLNRQLHGAATPPVATSETVGISRAEATGQ